MTKIETSDINEYSTLSCEEQNFFVLLNNTTSQWKIIEGFPNDDVIRQYKTKFGAISYENKKAINITIFVTNKCNLRCTYCRFDDLTHNNLELGVRNNEAIIKVIMPLMLTGKEINIYFQGGEPLIEIDLIERLCNDLTKDSNLRFPKFHIQSNGTILNDNIIRIIKLYEISLGLSIDGNKGSHDKHRFYANNKGSFDDIVKNMKRLKDNDIHFGLFCVITAPLNMMRTYQFFRDNFELSEFILFPISFNGSEDIRFVEKYRNDYVENIIGLLKYNIKLFKNKGIKITEGFSHFLLQRKLISGSGNNGCNNTPYSKCGTDNLTIERNGSTAECQNLRTKQNNGKEYIDRSIKRYGICDNCEIKGHCSLPVCFSRYEKTFIKAYEAGERDALKQVEILCNSNKKLEKELFKLLHEDLKGAMDYFFETNS